MAKGIREQRWRLMSLCTVFAACALFLLYRTYCYQVIEHQRFRQLASEEHRFQREIAPRRGDILDRNGHPFAITVMYDNLYARPELVENAASVADTLSRLIGEPKDQLLAKLQSGSNRDVLLKAKLPTEVSTKIANLNLRGISLQRQPFRGYPEGSIMAQLLGFVGKDFKGLAGLELSLEKELGGEPGLLDAEKDTEGSQITIGRKVLVPPRDGSDAILTIDRYIQRMVEKELAAAVK